MHRERPARERVGLGRFDTRGSWLSRAWDTQGRRRAARPACVLSAVLLVTTFGAQSYSQVRSFASQEAAKAAMNHMRWGLQAQVTPFLPALSALVALGAHAQVRHAGHA